MRLPVILRVANNGRVYALWERRRWTAAAATSRASTSRRAARCKPDGTFGGNQTYRIRYTDGPSERYRVNFSGRFLADGAVGTLRMTVTEKGYKPCRSGTVTVGGALM